MAQAAKPTAYIGTLRTPGRPARPRTAVVVDTGRVAAVVPVRDLPAGVHRRDFGGALITPGFVDAHVHLSQLGLLLQSVDLHGCGSARDALDRVRRHADRQPVGPVLGMGWDDTGWTDADRFAAELPGAAPGRAVYLARVDVHSALVTAEFAALADPGGRLTGHDGYQAGPAGTAWLRRDAHHRARQLLTDGQDRGRRKDALLRALRLAAARGLSCVHELGAPHLSAADDMRLLTELHAETDGALPQVVRYWGEHADAGGIDHARALGCVGAAGDLCVDGSVGSRTAALAAAYADAPAERSCGHLYLDADATARHLRACTLAGVQGGFHCIGDAGVGAAIEGLTRVADELGDAAVRRCRHRLEHAELWPGGPDQVFALARKLARWGVVASVQPAFDAHWGGPGGLYQMRLGRARAERMNPLATLADAGVVLAFGSDAPVTPLAPWAAIAAAVGHHSPDQRLHLEPALAAQTSGGWYAAGRSRARADALARLSPGAPAHLVVWPLDRAESALSMADPPAALVTLRNGLDLPASASVG